MRKSGKVALALIAAALATGGCSRIKDAQGYVPDEELIASVKPGVDNKQSVAKTLGRPSIAAQWSDNVWYYVSRETRQLAFRAPKAHTQTIIAVTFDAKGQVTAVQKRGLEQVASINPNGNETPTLGRQTSVWDAIFGNIGQVGGIGGQGGNQDNTGGP